MKEKNKHMVNRKTWGDFRETGLVLIINQILHVFGWAIVFEIDDMDFVSAVYPARVKFRGFDNKTVSDSHIKITKFLAENINELNEEAKG